MKCALPILLLAAAMILSACSSMPTASTPSEVSAPEVIVVTAINGTAQLVSTQAVPTLSNVPGASPAITLSDNRQTLNLHVGDSFLLNLGTDIYDWSVTIDNQSVVSLKMGMLVIQGAQGVFEARAPGTAILTAGGNPKCFQSNPPCLMPSILFEITIIVQ